MMEATGGLQFIINHKVLDYGPMHNNDLGDLHLKSQAGRFGWHGVSQADFNFDLCVNLIDFTEISERWLAALGLLV